VTFTLGTNRSFDVRIFPTTRTLVDLLYAGVNGLTSWNINTSIFHIDSINIANHWGYTASTQQVSSYDFKYWFGNYTVMRFPKYNRMVTFTYSNYNTDYSGWTTDMNNITLLFSGLQIYSDNIPDRNNFYKTYFNSDSSLEIKYSNNCIVKAATNSWQILDTFDMALSDDRLCVVSYDLYDTIPSNFTLFAKNSADGIMNADKYFWGSDSFKIALDTTVLPYYTRQYYFGTGLFPHFRYLSYQKLNSKVLRRNIYGYKYQLAFSAYYNTLINNVIVHDKSAIESNNNSLPNRTVFAFPNPFSQKTEIGFANNSHSFGDICIYDIKGALIYHNNKVAGDHISWDGSNYKSGVYLLKVTIQNKTYSKKLIIAR
jgi:hypothetical protein